MKKGKSAVILGIAAVVAAGIALVWYYASPKEKEPEFVFFYAENQAEDYPTTLGAKKFAELVEERTEGRIRILVQAEGVMGTENEVIQQMQYGGIDFARVSLSQLAEYVPSLNVLQMPYLYTDSEHMWRVLDGAVGDAFLDEVEGDDLVGLSWYDAGARNFYSSSRPISCLEDFAGMKIRVQESELMADMVEALGAEAVPLGYAEVYSSLERGIVDGAENNWPSYESMNHYEVARYYTVDEHTRVPEMQICSRYTWEKLSKEDREILAQCAKESSLYEREVWTSREEEARERVIAGGVEEVELSVEEKKRFQAAVMGVYEKYCGDYMDVIDTILAEGSAEETDQRETPENTEER